MSKGSVTKAFYHHAIDDKTYVFWNYEKIPIVFNELLYRKNQDVLCAERIQHVNQVSRKIKI